LARSLRYWIALLSLSGSIGLSFGLVDLGRRGLADLVRGRLIWSNFLSRKIKGPTRRPPLSHNGFTREICGVATVRSIRLTTDSFPLAACGTRLHRRAQQKGATRRPPRSSDRGNVQSELVCDLLAIRSNPPLDNSSTKRPRAMAGPSRLGEGHHCDARTRRQVSAASPAAASRAPFVALYSGLVHLA
jgi:hypothetical protein